MANSYLSLTDLAKINDFNVTDVGCSDLLDDAPLLAALAGGLATNGTEHKYVKETGAPVVGFRAINDGRENSNSADTSVTISLKVLDASNAVDCALADIFQGNASYAGGRDAYLARENKRHLKAALFGAEKQFINGTIGGAAAGFTGMADVTALKYKDGAMVVDAGGDTANSTTSVWLIRTSDDGTDVMGIWGNQGRIEQGDTVVQRVAGSSTGFYPAYYTPITAWLGLQVGSAYSIGRIVNLDFDHTLDDDMIYDALSLFPASRQPNLIVMNRTSLKHLRKSRTATNPTGVPAPRPTDVDGIPIIVTDAITNTEAVKGATP